MGSRDGTVVEHLPAMQASHQCGPGLIPGLGVIIMWVEFVVGSRPCSERFFSGYSGFPLSSKTNTSKFQFDLYRLSSLFAGVNTLNTDKALVCLSKKFREVFWAGKHFGALFRCFLESQKVFRPDIFMHGCIPGGRGHGRPGRS